MPIKHVAIVGAGIGGLAAALAIRQAGLSVSVYDQASRLEPLGASLTLWPNAMRCLRALGVAEPCCARARADSVHRGALAAWRHAGLRAHATLLRRSRRAGHLRHARRRTARASTRWARNT